MAKFPTPITADNFDQAAEFVSSALAKAKRKKMISRIVDPIGGLLFTLLSILLVFGAIYMLSSPEEMVVFEKLGVVTDLWSKLSGSLTTPDMPWFMYWGILIASAFLVPLAVSAIISIIVSLFVKSTDGSYIEGTAAEKAKALHSMATDLARLQGSAETDAWKRLFRWVFVIVLSALLVYAFVLLKMAFDVGMLIGFAICAVIVYFVYGLIYGIFNGLNRLFFKMKRVSGITDATDAYWLSVDPEEKARREAEKERLAKEAAEASERAARRRDIAQAKREEALEYEQYGNYSLAKQMFKEAAEMGDALAMDNYARHCLIAGNRSEAIRWLQKAVDTGEADSDAKAILQALKDGKNIDVHYGV